MFGWFKKKFNVLEKEYPPFMIFKNITNNKVVFENPAMVYGIPYYIPSNGTIIKRSGYKWKVMKTFADYDADFTKTTPIIIWLKEMPSD